MEVIYEKLTDCRPIGQLEDIFLGRKICSQSRGIKFLKTKKISNCLNFIKLEYLSICFSLTRKLQMRRFRRPLNDI